MSAPADDLAYLSTLLARIETYLRGKKLHGPMLGAQRRVEARIGQLLGEALTPSEKGSNGGRGHKAIPCVGQLSEIKPSDRQRFRVLARGLERGLEPVGRPGRRRRPGRDLRGWHCFNDEALT